MLTGEHENIRKLLKPLAIRFTYDPRVGFGTGISKPVKSLRFQYPSPNRNANPILFYNYKIREIGYISINIGTSLVASFKGRDFFEFCLRKRFIYTNKNSYFIIFIRLLTFKKYEHFTTLVFKWNFIIL